MLSWERMKQPLVLMALVLLGGRLIWLYVIPAWKTIITDFPNYYVSAWAVRNGDSLTELYNPLWFDEEKRRAGIERPAALFNYFPPMNAMIMWPVANLSPISAKRAWIVVNVLGLIAIIGLTVRVSGVTWPVAALLAVLGGDALGNNFTYGQFYVVLMLLLLAGIVLAKRYPSIAGFATSAGALTKLFPAFLLVYFAIRREYRALIWSTIGFAALAVLGFVTLGWAPHGTYLNEVLGRTLRGEIQDPYNIHWNTLQAFVRRALVRDELLNPQPIIDAPWLFFFLRPAISLGVVGVTLYSIHQTRQRHVLLAYGAIVAMVSLITPSQASYHQVLFYPAIAGLIGLEELRARAIGAAALFAIICSNAMGATAGYDSGFAMVLGFPRVWLVAVLWIILLSALNPPLPKLSVLRAASVGVAIALLCVTAALENRRWIADVSDGATRVPLPSPADLELQPRFVEGRLVTAVLGADGFINASPNPETFATSPDGKWTAFSTNARGNWDIAIRSKQSGEVRYLTSSSANDLTPSFSPDGRWVYFASDRHRGYRFTTIYRVSVDAR